MQRANLAQKYLRIQSDLIGQHGGLTYRCRTGTYLHLVRNCVRDTEDIVGIIRR